MYVHRSEEGGRTCVLRNEVGPAQGCTTNKRQDRTEPKFPALCPQVPRCWNGNRHPETVAAQ